MVTILGLLNCGGWFGAHILAMACHTKEKVVSVMDVPKGQVKCGVEDCRYNKSHLCQAENLVINPMGDNVVKSNAGTQCDTFKNRSVM